MSQAIPVEVQDIIDGKRSKFDLTKAVKCRLNGMSLQEIAEYIGTTKQNVHVHLKDLLPDYQGVDVIKEHGTDLWRQVLYNVHKLLTPERLKELNALQLSTVGGIAGTKITEAEAKQAPPPVNINLLGADIEKLDISINQLSQSIGISTDDTSNNEEHS